MENALCQGRLAPQHPVLIKSRRWLTRTVPRAYRPAHLQAKCLCLPHGEGEQPPSASSLGRQAPHSDPGMCRGCGYLMPGQPCEGQRGPLRGGRSPEPCSPARVRPRHRVRASSARDISPRGNQEPPPPRRVLPSKPFPSPSFMLNEQTASVSPETFHTLAHHRRTKDHPGVIRAAAFSEGVGVGGRRV